MVVEHAHGLRQRRGPNAKSSLHKAHLAPDAGLQAPGASLSFAQGSHDFESLDRGIGRGGRFETAHRLDQYLELSVIGLDHVIEILHLPVGRLPVQLSFALQFGDRCTIARRSEEHTSELQSLMRISYAVFCLKKTQNNKIRHYSTRLVRRHL